MCEPGVYVVRDSTHDQASLQLHELLASLQLQESRAAGVLVMYVFFMLCVHHLSLCLSLLKVFCIKTNVKSPNDCRYMSLYDSSSIGPNFGSISCSLGALGSPDHLCSSGADSGADC